MSYATILFVGTANNIIQAQEIRDFRLENVEKQVADINALRLDQRLVRIETILGNLEDHGWLSNFSTGGIGLLLARAVYEEIKRKKKSEDD